MKANGIKKPLELHKINFLKKIVTGAIFLLAPAANHGWCKLFSYWLHETAVCSYFGVDLGKGLDHHSLSRLADGTPYSSSDLPYFTLLLAFYVDKLFQVQLLSPFRLFGQKFSKSNSSSLSSPDKKF